MRENQFAVAVVLGSCVLIGAVVVSEQVFVQAHKGVKGSMYPRRVMVLLETPKPAIVVRLVEPHVDPSTVVLMPRLVDIQGSLFQEGIGNLVVDVLLLQEMCLFIRRSNATGTYNVKNTRKPARLTILVILHTSTYATLLVREGDLSIHVLEPSSLAEGSPSFRDARCVLRKAACSWVTFVLGHRTSPGPRFGCHVLAFLGVHRPPQPRFRVPKRRPSPELVHSRTRPRANPGSRAPQKEPPPALRPRR